MKKLLLGGLAALLAWPLSAQSPAVSTRDVAPVAGSREEEDVLLLQLLGRLPMVTSSIRPFTVTELGTFRPGTRPSTTMSLVRPTISFWYNSSRPYSENDGVVWTGRGLTTAVTGGFAARARWFSITVRPVAFWTQNQAFPRPRADAPGQYADPFAPTVIDQPYRFGDKSYGRIDPGESTAAIEIPFVEAGVSSASQMWGPMHVYPLLLGNNAGGFPHAFVRTSRPLPIYVGHLSIKALVGRLEPSAFATPRPGDRRRVASAMVAEFTPAFLPGVELGATRFFHRVWPTTGGIGLSDFTDLFQSFLKSGLVARPGYREGDDNQLASVFFRLATPASHAEVYGEYLRDDHSQNTRDLIGEPDHSSAYSLGLRRVWSDDAARRVSSLTIEGTDGAISKLVRIRGEGVIYAHNVITEGHTYLGQILGSPAVFGGRGLDIQYQRRYSTNGWSAHAGLEQVAQNHEGGSFEGQYLGFYRLGAARSRRLNGWDAEVGFDGYLSWQPRTPGNNVRATVTLRPY